MMKAFVDKDACIGCGLCTSICDEVFSMGDDGKAEAINKEIEGVNAEATEEACNSCPVGAISVE